MQNLIKFIQRFHLIILFILLEVVSFSLLLRSNHFHQSVFFNFSNNVKGLFHTRLNDFNEYLALKEHNDELAKENVRLLNELETYKSLEKTEFTEHYDSINNNYFRYTTARVINNSVNKKHNFILLNKGANDGIKQDFAVVNSRGIVGVVWNVSDNFSTVMPLLHTEFHISGKIKKNQYFGSVSWEGLDYREVKLNEIPHHVNIIKGDTIVTSGHSSIFPSGIIIGVVDEAEIVGSNFYDVKVSLSTDFKSLSNVIVVENLRKDEIDRLMEENNND